MHANVSSLIETNAYATKPKLLTSIKKKQVDWANFQSTDIYFPALRISAHSTQSLDGT